MRLGPTLIFRGLVLTLAHLHRRHFVIRVRAETEQFLLSSKSVDECIAWLEALSAAVDLSPALEERTLPRYQTTPRRRRMPVIEEQERIIRLQFPHLIEGIAEEEEEGGSRQDSTLTLDRNELIRPFSPQGMRGPRDSEESITEQHLRELRSDFEGSAASAPPYPLGSRPSASPSPHTTGTTSSTSLSSPPPNRRTITGPPASVSTSVDRPSSEGKWRPSSTLTPEANLRYVRRCMAVLRDDSPRLSDYIIKDGRRYRLVWDKRQLVPEGVNGFTGNRYWRAAVLPQYEDLMQGSEARAIEPAMSRPLTPRGMPLGSGVGPSRAGSG